MTGIKSLLKASYPIYHYLWITDPFKTLPIIYRCTTY